VLCATPQGSLQKSSQAGRRREECLWQDQPSPLRATEVIIWTAVHREKLRRGTGKQPNPKQLQ